MAPPTRSRPVTEHSLALARGRRRPGRAATAVALPTSPIVLAAFVVSCGWAAHWALPGALAAVVILHGAVDALAHEPIPAPAIYGAEREPRDDDVVGRPRPWWWMKGHEPGDADRGARLAAANVLEVAFQPARDAKAYLVLRPPAAP